MSKAMIQTLSFIAVVVLVTAAFIWLLRPYYSAVLWAVILAILFEPLQVRLERRLGGRRNLAAGLSLLACICTVVIPGSAILASLAAEAASLYSRVSTSEFDPSATFARMQDSLPPVVVNALQAMNLGEIGEIRGRLTSLLSQVSQTIANTILGIGQNTAHFVISLGIMLYLLFFLFRDGRSLLATVRDASPLSVRHTEHILGRFGSVIKATVMGNIVIAVLQGAIGGIAFWTLGIQGALLWGVLMAVLSLLPAVGAALVWVPVTIYLMLSGQYLKGAILLGIGMLVISLIDNLLRPPLVGKGSRLPDYVILISTLGGLALLGMNGFVIGPLIAALFIAVWSLFAEDELSI